MAKPGLIPMDAELLPPSDDRVFKLLLTKPEARPALINLLAAILERGVADVEIYANELPAEDVREKAERFDINCKLDDGSQVNIEMQASRMPEVLQMAGNLLMSISKDEEERAHYRSRKKFEWDMASSLATAKDIGREEGRAEGRAEGSFNTMLGALRGIMDTFHVPLDQAMAALGIPESDRARYKEILTPQG